MLSLPHRPIIGNDGVEFHEPAPAFILPTIYHAGRCLIRTLMPYIAYAVVLFAQLLVTLGCIARIELGIAVSFALTIVF